MKKLLSVLLSVLVITGMSSLSIFAELEGGDVTGGVEYSEDGTATFCFDTPASLSEWEFEGSADDTVFKLEITNSPAESGAGSLQLSETITGEIENKFGGAFITSETFGLPSFEGYSMNVSYLFDENNGVAADNFSIYTNGSVWVSNNLTDDSGGEWRTASISVPNGSENTIFGFTIPTFNITDGPLVYIDNIIISDQQGNILANTGDFMEAQTEESDAPQVSRGFNIFLTILLIVLIFAVIGGIGYLIVSLTKKFR